MPSGIYKRKRGKNPQGIEVNDPDHPWRKHILADVIIARKKPAIQLVKELREIFKNENI